MRFLIILLLALSFGACSFKKNGDEKPTENIESHTAPVETNVLETISQEQDKQAAEGILTEKNVQVRFEEMPEIGFYRLTITWPKTIRRLYLEVNDKKFTILSPTNEYTEIIEQNRTFNITLTSSDQLGAPISTLQLTKQSPLDYLVESPIELTKATTLEVQRLAFKGLGKIITRGYNLSIIANKIYFLDQPKPDGLSYFNISHIITHFPDTVATTAEQLKGSNITIEAKAATGELRVSLVGVHGRNGRSGEERASQMAVSLDYRNPALNGKNGEDGLTGVQTRVCGHNSKNCEPVFNVCKKTPTNGEDGKPGSPGVSGENGLNGGSSGSLSVFIDDTKEFYLKVGKRKGQPGTGGSGSQGFPGGVGGQAGASPAPCPASVAGREGPRGPRGDNGKTGEAAKDGTITYGKNFAAEVRDL